MFKHNKKLYIGISTIFFSIALVFLVHTAKQNVVDKNTIVAEVATVPYFKKTEAKKQNPPIVSPTPEKVVSLTNKTESEKEIIPTENTENVTLILGNETVNLSFAPNTIFYDALLQAENEGKIQFSGKEYPGLGFFVKDIGTLHSGGGKDLLYYINGKEASVGVSSYTLKDGDIIEWKLE